MINIYLCVGSVTMFSNSINGGSNNSMHNNNNNNNKSHNFSSGCNDTTMDDFLEQDRQSYAVFISSPGSGGIYLIVVMFKILID